MKKILLGLTLIVLSQGVLADSRSEKLEILECKDTATRVYVTLDSSNYASGSIYKAPVSAGIWFNYSTAGPMACTGFVRGNDYINLKCIGYYSYSSEITELKIKNRGDKVVAIWTTSKAYGSVEMQTECALRPKFD